MDWVQSWKGTLLSLLDDVPVDLRALIASMSIDGTSATTMLIDRLGDHNNKVLCFSIIVP